MRIVRMTLAGILGVALGLGARSLSAQTLFQNNNQPCESEPVLCSTGGCIFPDVNSLSCRNVNTDGTFSGADFDGDGFADCVAVREHNFNFQSTPEPQASVLINRGTSATACSPGPGDQFNPALTYTISGSSTSTLLSNVMTGDLNGGGTDFIIPDLQSGEKNMVIAVNPGGGFGPSGGTLTSVERNWEINVQNGSQDFFGQRTAVVLDCNNDTALDAAIIVEDQSPGPDFRINVLRNDGSGLQPIAGAADSFDTNVSWINFSDDVALTAADFNNDNNLDLALTLSTNSDGTPETQVATICLNDGNCHFTCPKTPTINLIDQHPGQNPQPTSIESGDFDGDGQNDIVVSEPGLSSADLVPTPEPQGIQYYFGNGNGTFTRSLFVPYNISPTHVEVLTTGCYNNDNVTDVAVTSRDSESILNNVGVFTSDGTGGIHAPVTLFGLAEDIRGIDSLDFDKAGGDDIAVIGRQSGNASVLVFMNSLEALSAIAGADQTAQANSPLSVSGASCAVSPELPGDPARFAVQWTVTSSPAGSSPVLNGATTLTPTFQSATPGAYTLQLQCRTRCTSITTDTKTITIGQFLPTPVPTATPAVFETQGGCLADLTPGGGGGTSWSVGLFLLVPMFWLYRRARRSSLPGNGSC